MNEARDRHTEIIKVLQILDQVKKGQTVTEDSNLLFLNVGDTKLKIEDYVSRVGEAVQGGTDTFLIIAPSCMDYEVAWSVQNAGRQQYGLVEVESRRHGFMDLIQSWRTGKPLNSYALFLLRKPKES